MFFLPPWLRASQPSGFRLTWLAVWAWLYFAVSAKALAPDVQPSCMDGATRCRCVTGPEKASRLSSPETERSSAEMARAARPAGLARGASHKASSAFPALMQGFGVDQQEAGVARGGGAGNAQEERA